MTPLKRSDPLTPETLERLGGVCNDPQPWEYRFQSNAPGPVFTLSIFPFMDCDGCEVWNKIGQETNIRMPENVGELVDLCQCLGITLVEVPA